MRRVEIGRSASFCVVLMFVWLDGLAKWSHNCPRRISTRWNKASDHYLSPKHQNRINLHFKSEATKEGANSAVISSPFHDVFDVQGPSGHKWHCHRHREKSRKVGLNIHLCVFPALFKILMGRAAGCQALRFRMREFGHKEEIFTSFSPIGHPRLNKHH